MHIHERIMKKVILTWYKILTSHHSNNLQYISMEKSHSNSQFLKLVIPMMVNK